MGLTPRYPSGTVAFLGHRDHFVVPSLAFVFVPADEQDCAALEIKDKQDAPRVAPDLHTQFFQVRDPRNP
jgi:hypothetical protein